MKNKNLARIHILKSQLGLSDEVYRNMLHSNYKVSSSKDLTLIQQNKLIILLTQQLPKTSNPNKLSSAQYSAIMVLSKKAPIYSLTSFISKIVSRTITNINYLTKKEASSVINALRRYEKYEIRTPAVLDKSL